MTFGDLYGVQLDRRLSSADTTGLFTTVRRKAAVNEAQLWWIVETGCLSRTAQIPIVDEQAEYDLEAEIDDDDFLQLAKQGPEIKADPGGGGTIVYYAGHEFFRTSIERLNADEPGWRQAAASTPTCWYERLEGGQHLIGLHTAPAVPSGATWTLNVTYVVEAATLSADADEPFTVDGNALRWLRPWHDALADYAAAKLELLRKEQTRHDFYLGQAASRVLSYLDKHRAPGGKAVRFARSYRQEARSRVGSQSEDQDT